MQVEPSSEMRKLLQAASKLQKKKGDSYLGEMVIKPYSGLRPLQSLCACPADHLDMLQTAVLD